MLSEHDRLLSDAAFRRSRMRSRLRFAAVRVSIRNEPSPATSRPMQITHVVATRVPSAVLTNALMNSSTITTLMASADAVLNMTARCA